MANEHKPMLKARLKLHYPKQPQAALDVDLNLSAEGVTAIVGHSGSGKTTLLRCIAGLEKADIAQLNMSGKDWHIADNSAEKKGKSPKPSFTPTQHRAIGYVFQEASLFPHLSVQGNLDYAIKRRHQCSAKVQYQDVINLLNIQSLLPRSPNQLSGGERQRVAIARALLRQPELLLMDEPLAALDSQIKREILQYLQQLQQQHPIPTLYVTHSLEEAARLADQVVVLKQGKVQLQGKATAVFSQLNQLQLQTDIEHLFDATVIGKEPAYHLMQLSCHNLTFHVPNDPKADIGSSTRFRVNARDVSLSLKAPNDSSILNCFALSITALVPHNANPALVYAHLQQGPVAQTEANEPLQLTACITQKSAQQLKLSVGQQVYALVKSVAIIG